MNLSKKLFMGMVMMVMMLPAFAQTDPTVEVCDVWITNDQVTPIGILKTYGTYDVPDRMEATVRSQDGSFTKTVYLNGSIIKTGDNNRSDSRRSRGSCGDYYTLPTVTVPQTGTYVINVGVRAGGWKVVYGKAQTRTITKKVAANGNSGGGFRDSGNSTTPTLPSKPILNSISGEVSPLKTLALKGNVDFSKYDVYLNLHCDTHNKQIWNEEQSGAGAEVGSIPSSILMQHQGCILGVRAFQTIKNNKAVRTDGNRITFKVAPPQTISSIPENQKMPKEGGGFLSERISYGDGVGYQNTLYLYIPRETADFFFTGRTWETWLTEQGIDFTKGQIKDAVFKSFCTALKKKAGEAAVGVVGLIWDLYGAAKFAQSITDFVRDTRNDNIYSKALSNPDCNSNCFLKINMYITYGRNPQTGIPIYSNISTKYEVLQIPYNSTAKPTNGKMTFYSMSVIKEGLKRYGLNLAQSGNIRTASTTPSNTTTATQQPLTYTTSNFSTFGRATKNSDCIGWIDTTSGFRFTVNSTSNRTVSLNIKYRSDNRGGILKVNGVTKNISFPSTNWAWGAKEISGIQLKNGTNIIEFYGGYQTEYAPDLAEITVK
ncbi:MAG: hypothetical protein LBO74_03675 [Candidatus Symbiothrix sp.]|nr:hypothetical protein [Candidatus Symbiothrix sp.]